MGAPIGGVVAACRFASDGTITSRLNVASVVHEDDGDYTVTLDEGVDDADCCYIATVNEVAETRTFAIASKTGNKTFRVLVHTTTGEADRACSLLVVRTNIG